jgi:putative endonuclease
LVSASRWISGRSGVRLPCSPQSKPSIKRVFFMFIVYIIYSANLDQYYIGHCESLEDRLFRHTNSGSKATKKANDWKLVYKESFETRSAAFQREMEIKRKKSRKYIDWLVNSVG